MIYLQLFWAFVKVGFTSFGGLSMLPLISAEMLSHGWMTQEEVTNLVAIAEMTPGPIGLNCASFAGMRSAGVLGAIVANLGILAPSFTVGLAAAVSFAKFKENALAEKLLTGIRPACIGMIFGIVVSICSTNYIFEGRIDPASVLIGALSLFLLLKKKVSVPKVIIISGVLGMAIHAIAAV